VTRHRPFIFTCPVVALLAAAATFANAAGCKSQQDRDRQAEEDRQVAELRKHAKWDEQPTPFKQEPVMVTQGRTPLVHLFDIGGPVRIVDLTAKSQLAAVTVPDRTLVRVDDRNGVTIGLERVMPGPLPPGHEYGIYLDPTTPNVYRQGIGPPGDAPRP
jgi:hypothetical protein